MPIDLERIPDPLRIGPPIDRYLWRTYKGVLRIEVDRNPVTNSQLHVAVFVESGPPPTPAQLRAIGSHFYTTEGRSWETAGVESLPFDLDANACHLIESTPTRR